MNEEIWKPVFGYEGRYEISNLGRVRAIFPARTRAIGPRYLHAHKDRDGYFKVTLSSSHDKRQHVGRICRLVASAFIRPPKDEEEANHIDGIKSNDDVSNLEWLTQKENIAHATKNGLKASGERLARTKLKEEQVIEILSLRGVISYDKIAEKFNVTKSAINHIMNGRSWNTGWSLRRVENGNSIVSAAVGKPSLAICREEAIRQSVVTESQS